MAWGMISDPVAYFDEVGGHNGFKDFTDEEIAFITRLRRTPQQVAFDVTAAYLQAPLPEAFACFVTCKDQKIVDAIVRMTKRELELGDLIRLEKGLYGHPLSGDVWANECSKVLAGIGFCYLDRDEERTIYAVRIRSQIIALLVLYVDDGLLLSYDPVATERVHALLVGQWSARDWEDISTLRIDGEDAEQFPETATPTRIGIAAELTT